MNRERGEREREYVWTDREKNLRENRNREGRMMKRERGGEKGWTKGEWVLGGGKRKQQQVEQTRKLMLEISMLVLDTHRILSCVRIYTKKYIIVSNIYLFNTSLQTMMGIHAIAMT